MRTWVVFFFLASLSAIYAKNATVCYYRNWAQYAKAKEAKFTPADIDAKLCSVINYANNQINNKTWDTIEGRRKNDNTTLQELVALKKDNPDLKIQVTVGGWSHEKYPRFAKMIKCPKRRAAFVASIIQYIQDHSLDGVNVDWEYPGYYDRKEKNKFPKLRSLGKHKPLFVTLLKALRKALVKASVQLGRNLTLTLAVPNKGKKIADGYDIKGINEQVDSIDIMAYNLRGPWRNVTGCPTLTKGEKPNVPNALDIWIKGGMDPSKVNLGMVSYGRTFKLEKNTDTDILSPITGPGDAGNYTKKAGILAYYEICKKVNGTWNLTPADKSECGAPYASDKTEGVWVGYDDPASIRSKVINYVNKRGLNGISLWALDFDDFSGTHCGQGRYPLLNAAIKAMNE